MIINVIVHNNLCIISNIFCRISLFIVVLFVGIIIVLSSPSSPISPFTSPTTTSSSCTSSPCMSYCTFTSFSSFNSNSIYSSTQGYQGILNVDALKRQSELAGFVLFTSLEFLKMLLVLIIKSLRLF